MEEENKEVESLMRMLHDLDEDLNQRKMSHSGWLSVLKNHLSETPDLSCPVVLTIKEKEESKVK